MNQTIVYTSPDYDKIHWLNCDTRPNLPSRVNDFNGLLSSHIPYSFKSILQIGKKMLYSEHCSQYVTGKIPFSHSVIFNAFALIVSPDNQTKLTGYFYKAEQNGVSKQNGDFFCFCEPNNVISELNKLIKYINTTPDLSPIEQAAIIFYTILKVHPFEDNNGKTARLLCDMTLVRCGQQPAFNVSYDREKYKQVIDCADEGEYSEIVMFIQRQQLYSASNF